MASTYSDLKIELIGLGEQTGTWGTTTNTNLGTALEEAIVGRATANFTSDANLTLSLTNANTSQVARHFVLNCTSSGSLTSTRDLIIPSIEKPYIIQNNTTGGQSIRVITVVPATALVNGATTATTSLVVDNNVGTIVQGAIVTGTGIVGTVTIATVTSQTNLVLSSAQTLADNASLTFTLPSVTVTNGKTAFIYSDGTNVLQAITELKTLAVTENATVGGTLAVTGTSAFTGAITSAADATFSGTGQVKLPVGTTAQRSASPVNGMIRYSSTENGFEGYQAGAWGGISGAQANGCIYENNVTITSSYTFTANKNGFSVGPITINSGAVVTIGAGQRWVVL